jgi:hypothetical protein
LYIVPGNQQYFFSQIGGFVATFKPKGTLIQCMFISPRQGEFLHDLAVIYESITGIDHWWIGLSDVGEHTMSHCPIFI